MLFQNITIVDENFEVKEHRYVGVQDDRITYIGEQRPTADFGEIYNGNGKLLIPAFYNLHSHLPMMLMRGYGEGLPLMDWLNNRIFPFEAGLTDDDMYYGCLAGIAEMLRFGIASSTEMYLSQAPLCRAFADSGVKGNISRCVSCFDPAASYFDLPQYREVLDGMAAFDGADNGRIRVEFSLHSEYTTTEKVVREMAQVAKERGSSMHIHVSETAGEVAGCRERHDGKSPVQYLADCGVFDVPTVAAHCVHVDDDDIAILKAKKVTVAANPKSNLKLASGISPLAKMLDAGVNVGIGTDSVASNNNLNMIEEMRFFNLLQKGMNYDPTLISPKDTLYAATRAGAIGQGRADCGLIKEGFRADIVVLDTDKVYMKPAHNLLNNLIYSAQGTDVVLTMADGKVLYRDGDYPTMDIEKIMFECEKSRTRILEGLNK